MPANNTVVFGFIGAFQAGDDIQSLELKIKEWLTVNNFCMDTVKSSADVARLSGQVSKSYYEDCILHAIELNKKKQ